MDPTREEMLAWFADQPFASETDEFDREEAIYWFASDYHGGQWSNLYSALCQSPYQAGAISNGCEPDSMAEMLYLELVADFAGE